MIGWSCAALACVALACVAIVVAAASGGLDAVDSLRGSPMGRR